MKILFLVSEDWYFCSHRLPIARAARDAGFDVSVVTRVSEHGRYIEEEGFQLIPLEIRRRSKNPFHELATLRHIVKIYRKEKPDLVHHVSLKPVIYGSFAARVLPCVAIVNALAGLGFVFTSRQPQARIIKWLVKKAFRLSFNRVNSCVLLQNPDDQKVLTALKLVSLENTRVILGSGVDTNRFLSFPEEKYPPIVVTLVARMLRDKGVVEFVEASKRLRQQRVPVRAILVGSPDPENPTSISVSQLEKWQSEGWVEWWGQCDDIPEVWKQSHIAVLPSAYGEGVPMSLIEAAACGRPIVTTDTPGCREIVQDGVNGLLIPVGDSIALADAIKRLAADAELRERLSQQGRKLVEANFSEDIIVEQTLCLYGHLLGNR